jgi:hypothetical protein
MKILLSVRNSGQDILFNGKNTFFHIVFLLL